MADVYKGLTIQFGAETTALTSALKSINKQSRDIGAELRKVENALKFNPNSTELLRQKQELLGKQITTTKDRLDALRQAQAKIERMYADGEIDDGAYRAFQRDLIETGSKLDNLERKAKGTNQELKVKPEVHGSFDKLKTGIRNVAAVSVAAAAAGAAAFTAMAVKVLENADAIQRQSDITGVSAERLQELQFVGGNLGVELDTLAGAQARLTKNMAAAKDPSSKQAEVFKRLGVSVTDSKGQLRDAKDVMFEAFDALNGVGNETERDAMAMAILGKSAMELNPLITAGKDELAKLSEQARDSSAVMSNEAVAGLDSFGDAWGNLQAGIQGGFGTFFSEFAPEIQAAIGSITNSPEFKGFVSEFADLAREFLPMILDLIVDTAPQVLNMMSSWLRLTIAMKPVFSYIAQMVGNIVNLWSRAISSMNSFATAGAKILMRPFEILVANVNKVINQLRKIPGFGGLKLITLNSGVNTAAATVRGATGGRIPQFATGGSFAPGNPTLGVIGDQRGQWEHVLRDDQIVALMRRAIGGGGGGITQNFYQPVRTHSEMKRAARDIREEAAWG